MKPSTAEPMAVTNTTSGIQGFPTSLPYFTPKPPELSRNDLMRELGTTGLWRFGGTVREEFLRDLQARKGVQIYREMRENHPVINAVFFAIEMALRQVRWFVEPASQDDADKENAEFLESCIDDMSFTWQDTLAQVITMLQYGFSLFEIVYKIRKGAQDGELADSQYDDGKVGWRKWLPLAQDTLAPGREWIWDQSGGVQGINQMAPPDWILRTLPIEKLLLFRTSVAKNNPEGRSILRGMYIPWYYCFSDDTQLLTREGWKGIDELTADDQVATLDPQSNVMEYEQPQEVIKFPFDGDLIHAEGRDVDQLVTPNHRMWVKRAASDQFEFIAAEKCTPTVNFKATAEWNVPGISTITVGENEISADDWFQFMGWYLAEGHCGHYDRQRIVAITQKSGEKADEIRTVLKQLPWSFYEHVHQGDILRFTFTRKELYEHLAPLGDVHSKHIPDYVLNASARQIGLFLDAYWKGDGTIAGTGTRLIFTASREMADDLAEAILKIGHRPQIHWKDGNGFGKGVWVVTIGKPFEQLRAHWSKQPYHGWVWCVTTKNGIVYSRRNGKSSWSGNSKNLQEIEGIAMERLSAGFPVVYLGEDTNKDPNNANSDLALAKQIVRDTRADEQSGVVIPYPKMGQGAGEGKGMLFEFAAAPSRASLDFEQPIQRYNKQIAMTCLAEFIMLGMDSTGRGSYALSKNKSDMFVLALSSWAEMIVQVVNRFAVKRLFDLNNMDTTQLPLLTHSEVAVPDLAELGTYINQLAGAQLITPDMNLEAVLREKAHLPPPPADSTLQVGNSEGEAQQQESQATEDTENTEGENPNAPNPKNPMQPIQPTGPKPPNVPNSGPNGALARNMPPRVQSGDMATRQRNARLGNQNNQRAVPGSSYATSARVDKFHARGKWTTLNGVGVVAVGKRQPIPVASQQSSVAREEFADDVQWITVNGRHIPIKAGQSVGDAIKEHIGKSGNLQAEKNKTAAMRAKLSELKARNDQARSGAADAIKKRDETYAKLKAELAKPGTTAELQARIADLKSKLAKEKAGLRSINRKIDRADETGADIKLSDTEAEIEDLSELLSMSTDLFQSSKEDFQSTLADSRRAIGGARYETATNAYQAQLEKIYTDWYDGLAADLADEKDENKREEILLAALVLLEDQLKRAGRDGILEAMQLGAGDTPLTADALSALAQSVQENDNYIEASLIPAIRNKAQNALRDTLLLAGGVTALSGVFATFIGRVSSYAGAAWEAVWVGLGDRLNQEDTPLRVQRVLDDQAQHCSTCPAKADIYDSFEQMQSAVGIPGDGSDECHSNCRCTIRVETSPGSGVFERF